MQFKCRITIIIILAGKNVAQHEAKKEEMIFPFDVDSLTLAQAESIFS